MKTRKYIVEVPTYVSVTVDSPSELEAKVVAQAVVEELTHGTNTLRGLTVAVVPHQQATVESVKLELLGECEDREPDVYLVDAEDLAEA